MDNKWFNIELLRLNIELPWSRHLWNQASDEIYNLRPHPKTDSLVSAAEKSVILLWSWPGIRPFVLPTLSQCSWAAAQPLIFSFVKTPGQLVFVFCDCSALFFYLKFLPFHSTAALPKNPCLSTRTRYSVVSLEGQKKAWCLRMGEYSSYVVWFKLEKPQNISYWEQLTSPPENEMPVEVSSRNNFWCYVLVSYW